MRTYFSRLRLSMAVCALGISGAILSSIPATAKTSLTHWPPAAAAQLEKVIKTHANSGAYAVFDMDNTSYRYDLEESLLPFMEQKGLITRAQLPEALKIIPFQDSPNFQETLYSYYVRLCEIDDQVCYPWVAQIFSGFALKDLKQQVDALLATETPIPVQYYNDKGEVVNDTVTPPRVFRGMQELYHALMENGIEVYVVSAASEDLVRMVAADPKHGYGAKPENVIGVSMLLQDPATKNVTTVRELVTEKKYDPKALDNHILTSYLWAPLTWYEGKSAAINTYIDPWKKAILVAGDTPVSDGPMLFHKTDVAKGGVRVWVNRKDKYLQQIQNMQRDHLASQKALGLPLEADKNWIIVKPADIQ